MSDTAQDRFEEFVRWLHRAREEPKFEADEITYKREIADNLGRAKRAVESDDPSRIDALKRLHPDLGPLHARSQGG
jgi:hypothetical protein